MTDTEQQYISPKDRIQTYYEQLLAMPMVADQTKQPTADEIQQFCDTLNAMCGVSGGILPYVSRMLSTQFATACDDRDIDGNLNRSYPAYIVARGSGCGPLLCGAPASIIATHYGLEGRVFLSRGERGRYRGEIHRKLKPADKKQVPTNTTHKPKYQHLAGGYENKKQKEYASWQTPAETTTQPKSSVVVQADHNVEVHVQTRQPKVKTGMSLAAARRAGQSKPTANFVTSTAYGDLADAADLFE